MSTTPSSSAREAGPGGPAAHERRDPDRVDLGRIERGQETRAQAPIRWPKPDRAAVVSSAVWLVGLLIALVVPAIIVPPTELRASVAHAWTAFGFTVLGAALMIVSMLRLWRRTGDSTPMIIGMVPGMTVIVGGVIFLASKVYGVVT